MFQRGIQAQRSELEIRRTAGVFLHKIRGVRVADETLSRILDISSQSKQKLRVNGEVKSSKSMPIKTRYPDFLHAYDFLCFNTLEHPCACACVCPCAHLKSVNQT